MNQFFNVSGVPLIIHTNVFVSHFKGLNFDIEPIEIISPSGIAASRVTMKIIQFSPNPSSN